MQASHIVIVSLLRQIGLFVVSSASVVWLSHVLRLVLVDSHRIAVNPLVAFRLLWAGEPRFSLSVGVSLCLALGLGYGASALLLRSRLRGTSLLVFATTFACPVAYIGAAIGTWGLPEIACFAPSRREVLAMIAFAEAPAIALTLFVAASAGCVSFAQRWGGRA